MPTPSRRGLTAVLLTAGLAFAGLVAAPGAQARSTTPSSTPSHAYLGTTTVTTAPGIATTLLSAGIAPLPVSPARAHVLFRQGIAVSYGFPIVGNTANLAAGTGHITHVGGIKFASLFRSLEIGNFDVDLAAGKIFATQVNYQANRIPVLDLDLSNVHVGSRDGRTVVSGIKVKLDPVAATAINSTFGAHLPTAGSLVFGSAVIRIKS